MAGEAVLSGFMQVLFEKVSAFTLNEIGKIRTSEGVDKELHTLSSTLSTIQALVEDAEEKQLENKFVRHWLSRLKDIAYEMDELLDDYAARNPKSQLEQTNPSRWIKVKNYLSCFCLNNGLFKYQIVVQIKEIREKLDNLARERDALGLQMFGEINRLTITERPKTSSFVDNSSVFGRDHDKEKIINMLLSPVAKSSRVGAVIPIVGMGGLGKTTLAQLVYNDVRIKDHFEMRMWVYVSENFDEVKLTRETLESVSGSLTFATTSMDPLQKNLCDKVKGKRFLLVLDDVWNEDLNRWHSYYNALTVAENGSKIIVTTQNESVGRVMRGLSPPYHLDQLSDEDCWKLFKDCAFVNGDSSVYPNLEVIGKEIVMKLKGLPLAVKALGSLLYSKVDEEAWRNILKSEIWELPPDKNSILPALRLSYKHLPPHLKQCFAFCSVFHKDYMFERNKLVQIWIALGFVQPQGRRRLEDIGNSYFDDLVGRSFFQCHKGRFVMHDAIHDLAQSISIDECLRLELEENARRVSVERIKHLSFSCHNSKATEFRAFFKFKKLRTLLLLRGYKSTTSPIPTELMINLRYVRVLDLNRREIYEIPESIHNLKQLRYLNISGTSISKLPSTVGTLRNLQTLKMKNCVELDELPRGITLLLNLRHLETSSRLMGTINGIGSLTCLQELEEFVVRKEKGYKIRELGGMNELGGNLSIKDLENVNNKIEASDAMLNKKEYLTVLHLIWSDERHITLEEKRKEDQILECLRPNDQLKEITIKGFTGSKFPTWLTNLSFIRTIHISDCKQCISLPSLGQLRLLKYLDIGDLDAVVCIDQEFEGITGNMAFPSLTELVLQEMSNLEQWVSDGKIALLPHLNELQLLQCPKLQDMPLLPPTLTRIRISESGFTFLPQMSSNSITQPSLESLQINDCPNLKSLHQGLLSQQLGSIKQLTITDCEELVEFPLHGFRSFQSLKSLHIYNCPKLAPIGHDRTLLPPLIEDLRITSSNKIINPVLSEITHLSSLAYLCITDCDDLISFRGLPLGLKFLGIYNCKNLLYLPDCLRDLQSLVTLTITDCPLIRCLPVKGLPEMLQELHIKDSPLLTKSCQEGQVDWHKITHVSTVEIIDEVGGLDVKRIMR
ncbi:hypothetical protein LUZ60_011141 [Juncus effusus]|nr:hypothetical protein LUZ60_011141 [Juncus effusus]